jgi:hypothetical protein
MLTDRNRHNEIVRQSGRQQVAALGWARSRSVVIGDHLGPSGSTAVCVRARVVSRSVPDETERVPGRIREDAPAPLPVTLVEQCGAPVEDVFLGLIKVFDPQVKVELLGVSGVRPPRRLMVVHSLESQHEPAVGVERRPAVIRRPSRIRLVHYPAEKPLVEPGQLSDVSTVQHHTLQIGDHEGQGLTTPDHDLQVAY